MFFYNIIIELFTTQILFLLLLEAVFLLLAVFIFKIKISSKIVLQTIIVAIILSLLSIVVVRGDYGGMAYHERFGWPFQYHGVSRNIELGTDIAIPYQVSFDSFKFVINTLFWSIFPFIFLIFFTEKVGTQKKLYFLTSFLLVFVFLPLFFSYTNNIGEQNRRNEGSLRDISSYDPNIQVSDKSNICISVFSGMPDPCVNLSEQQTIELVGKIKSLLNAESSAYIPDIGLGYRGITGNLANNLDLSIDKSFVMFQVFNGLVEYNPDQKAMISSMSYTNEPNPNLIYKVDKNRELEKWLASLIAVDSETQKLVDELFQK
jgi:hypothetical protein